jgi:hypothetical protein
VSPLWEPAPARWGYCQLNERLIERRPALPYCKSGIWSGNNPNRKAGREHQQAGKLKEGPGNQSRFLTYQSDWLDFLINRDSMTRFMSKKDS